MSPLLLDATTLRNFAVGGCLDVLEAVSDGWSQPHWTEAVSDELQRGSQLGESDCLAVLSETWLGAPIVPGRSDQRSIQRLMVGLSDGDGPTGQNAGEAESIHFAEAMSGQFATDDNAAYDLASRRLGDVRTLDTVELLRVAVEWDVLTPGEALEAANSIRLGGRFLRRAHPGTLGDDYFL